VAVISGELTTDGDPVPTDLFSPITSKNRGWLLAEMKRAAKDK